MTIAFSVPGVLVLSAHANATNGVLSLPSSASRQFTAYWHPVHRFSSVVCVFASASSGQWLAQLDAPDNWRDPILIVVRERKGSTDTATPTIRVGRIPE